MIDTLALVRDTDVQGRTDVRYYARMDTEEVRTCTKCGIEKLLSEYYRHRSGSRIGKPHAKCKSCNTKYCLELRRNPGAHAAATQRRLQFEAQHGVRVCTTCDQARPLADYPVSRGNRARRCRTCSREIARAKRLARPDRAVTQRRAILKHKYQISDADYDQMLDAQNGVCAICDSPPDCGGKFLAVDHSHETGSVRGLLCGPCNRGIGAFKDDPVNIYRAIDYLEASKVLT